MQLYIVEDEPEVLARHLLLLSVLLDRALPIRARVETFLELHGNALLQQRTAEYAAKRGQLLEDLVLDGKSPQGMEALAALADFSKMKFKDRDAVAAALRQLNLKVAFDMQRAWEARCRSYYQERYDTMRNAIDWDYHMKLAKPGALGGDSTLAAHIIALPHFRTWRLTGLAYEQRDCSYPQPNRLLLSTAQGRSKEFKDRQGNDRGRSVSAWGFWGDILNSPYHCFGTACEDPALFRVSNQRFVHTSVDVAERNVEVNA
eukprot:jgi/Astpho2/6572/Aster-x0284